MKSIIHSFRSFGRISKTSFKLAACGSTVALISMVSRKAVIKPIATR
jgi:hypothetical protein